MKENAKITKDGIDFSQRIEYERILRTHEKRAKVWTIKKMKDEYIAQGIDETLAGIMAKTFYEYNI